MGNILMEWTDRVSLTEIFVPLYWGDVLCECYVSQPQCCQIC